MSSDIGDTSVADPSVALTADPYSKARDASGSTMRDAQSKLHLCTEAVTYAEQPQHCTSLRQPVCACVYLT